MKRKSSQRGFALVLVLSLIVLVVGILVTFLLTVSTERTSSGGFAAAISAQNLANSAVSVVQSQINDATNRGSDIAWASQPGMIRTFDRNGLVGAYKLYSAAAMIDSQVDLTKDLPPSDWSSKASLWVDLNAPVTANGVKHFPIVAYSRESTGVGANTTMGGIGAVEGFKIDQSLAPGATVYQPAPMPVRWLYVLRDGSMVAPTPDGPGDSVLLDRESSTNPAVGRIAFWTDDDTSKVNINTASEGCYWDQPKTLAQTNWDYAMNQPAKNEFQRYPGHPATVSLSAIFPGLHPEDIYAFIPRVTGDSDNPNGAGWTSLGGTQEPKPVVDSADITQGVRTDGERLFTSIDELMFKPVRSDNAFLSRDVIETRRFFLTATSRTPETNLFNLPRVSMWPVYKTNVSNNRLDPSRTNAVDRLLAMCSSTGPMESADFRVYYFQREKPLSPSNDISIPRNDQLLNYLEALTAKEIPRFGGNFLAKYGPDRDQILTEIFDYIRSSNLYDSALPGTPDIGSNGLYTTYFQFTPPSVNWFDSSKIKPLVTPGGHGFVSPSHGHNGSMGIGRFYTVSEIASVFICNADEAVTSSNLTVNDLAATPPKYANKMLAEPYPTGPLTPLVSGQKRIQAMMLPELYCVAPGWVSVSADMRIRIRGLQNFKINGVSLGYPADGIMNYHYDPRYINGGTNFGASLIHNGILPYKKTNVAGRDASVTAGALYPFVGAPLTVTGSTMAFEGGAITIDLYAGSDLTDTSAVPVQTININVASGSFPVPGLSSVKSDWAWDSTGFNSAVPGRLNLQTGGSSVLNVASDVIRSMMPSHGDYRVVAASKTVPADVFTKHRYYDRTDKPIAASFSSGGQVSDDFDVAGKIFPDIQYLSTNYQYADIPVNPSTAPGLTGDYDTGVTSYPDGPFINKPDEGDAKQDASDLAPYYGMLHRSDIKSRTYFSANRILPSPGMFGSLPSGVRAGKAWQTLLFRPQAGHPGAAAPADHLLLDLFWMPIVEPYALSDRFSTAGKVNLNYQILPFTYMERSSAIRAAMKNEKVWSISDAAAKTYKSGGHPDTTTHGDANLAVNLAIDLDETLRQFQSYFDAGSVFVSPSEICNLHIVPKGATLEAMPGYWNTHRLTGDNLRERIYTDLYGKITTKSNTYTIHYWAQSLKKSPLSPDGRWTEGRDSVLGEYRGSTSIERFINPAADIPDYAAQAATLDSVPTLDAFYKWRTISNRQFAP